MLIRTHRLMEAVRKEANGGGDGGNAPAPGPPPSPPEFLKAFGEHAKPFESFKDPATLAKTWTEREAELNTLKGQTDWRKTAATVDGKEDEAIAKALARYTDLPSVAKALVEAQGKIRSGELAKPLTKDSTPEQIAEYRKAHGIPEKVEGYFEKLPNGLVIGKDDQGMFNAAGKIAHEHNLPPAVMHDFVKWYYDNLTTMQTEESRLDDTERLKVTQELRTLYGGDYQPNMNILESWLDGLGAEGKELFKGATLGDGSRLMNSRPHMEFLIKHAREFNPIGHLIPNGDGSMKSLDTEIAMIENVMKTDRKRYNGDEKMQAKLRELYATREKLNKK